MRRVRFEVVVYPSRCLWYRRACRSRFVGSVVVSAARSGIRCVVLRFAPGNGADERVRNLVNMELMSDARLSLKYVTCSSCRVLL